MYVIKIHERANRTNSEIPLKQAMGEHIFFKEIDYTYPRGVVRIALNPNEAMKFDSQLKALEKYREVHPRYPFREDTKLNRPLTAFTIEVVSIKDSLNDMRKGFSPFTAGI